MENLESTAFKTSSYRISDEARLLLKLIAKKQRRGVGDTLMIMIEEEAARLKIKLPTPMPSKDQPEEHKSVF